MFKCRRNGELSAGRKGERPLAVPPSHPAVLCEEALMDDRAGEWFCLPVICGRFFCYEGENSAAAHHSLRHDDGVGRGFEPLWFYPYHGLDHRLAFVPVAMTAIVYGPAAGAVVGGLADLIGALLFPFGPYHPGFTVVGALMGAVYGWFLYDKEARFFPHIAAPSVLNNVVLGLYVNTLWVSQLYGSRTYWGWFVYRLPQYAILVPVNLILLPVLLQLAKQIKKYR